MPGPRAAGRAAWRVQAFCLRQNLGGGGIHFRRAFISNGVPAGRQPCGVVLPWSTWAMMATFLKCSFCIVLFSFFYGKAMPGPRAAGRAAWRVQAFCLRQNLGGGGIHFRRAFISNGVPAGRQPCGVVLPWSTWAMMATFLKCSFCIVLFSFFYGKATRGPAPRGAPGGGSTHATSLPAARFRPQVEICTQFCIICRSLVFCKPFLPGFSKKTAGFCNFYGKAPAEAPLLRRFR